MRKRSFTRIVHGVLWAIFVICVSLIVYTDVDNMDWSVEYKNFQITDVYSEQNTIYSYSLVVDGVVPIECTNYYINLEDEFGFGSRIEVSRYQFEILTKGDWIECSLLNNGGNSSALIPYNLDLNKYSPRELYDLYSEYPKVHW